MQPVASAFGTYPSGQFIQAVPPELYVPCGHFIQDLKPGEWNHVMYEIPHIRRDRITVLRINQMLTGHNPEENGIVTYDIDKVELQNVITDQYEGWNVTPGKISFSHVGYRPEDPKIAMAGKGAGNTFKVTDNSGITVYSGKVTTLNNINKRVY